MRYHNSHTHHLRHQQQQQHNSMPNSPNEMDMGLRSAQCKSTSNSANTSPVSANKQHDPSPTAAVGGGDSKTFFVRTSRSEDQLQNDAASAVAADVDDDLTSSLNTLLDTRPVSEMFISLLVALFGNFSIDSFDVCHLNLSKVVCYSSFKLSWPCFRPEQ